MVSPVPDEHFSFSRNWTRPSPSRDEDGVAARADANQIERTPELGPVLQRREQAGVFRQSGDGRRDQLVGVHARRS